MVTVGRLCDLVTDSSGYALGISAILTSSNHRSKGTAIDMLGSSRKHYAHQVGTFGSQVTQQMGARFLAGFRPIMPSSPREGLPPTNFPSTLKQ
jgi:hypothetical protein